MSDETPEDEGTAAEPVKVKQVAISAGLVAAALTAAVAFTVAGPLGVGIAAAGVAGTGYTVHRIRNPRKGTLLHSLLTRPRSTKTKGTLTWPFTGSQQRRAIARHTKSSSGRASGLSSRSKLPSLTSTRAKRSAALSGRSAAAKTGGAKRGLGTTAGRRPLTTTSGGRTKPNHGVSGRGLRNAGRPGVKPSTPTRTPSKLSRSTLSPAKRPNGTSSKASRPLTRSGTPLRLTNSRSRHRPVTSSPTRRGLLSLGSKNTGAGGKRGRLSSGKGSTPGRFSTTARRRPTGRGRFNPWLGTRGGQSLGGRSTGSRRTRRAGRLGGTLGGTPRTGVLGRLRHRVTPDHGRNRSPNRALRPRPYARRTTGQLLRTSLRVPKRQRGTYGSRNGWRPFVRPNRTQAARARRTLRLRSGVWARRGIVWIAKTPARRWDRLMDRLPKAPLPLTHYTEKQAMKAPSGPKAATKPGNPTPPKTPSPLASVTPITRDLIPIKQNGNVVYVSSPNDMIREAFQQLAAFHPGSASEVEAWIADLGETLNDVGRSFGVLADQMRDGMPFAAPFADSVREVGVAIAASSGLAQSAHATMRSAHEADFKRYEDPRPDEGMWNPEANR